MTSIFKKTLAVAMTTAVIAGTMAATPASARYGRNAAFFGGLAIGALAGGALSGGYGGGYYNSGYGYGGGCWVEQRPRYNHWGDVIGYYNVRICN
jgi:hypothetical protein